MLEAFGLPSMQGSAGTWGWSGEGRGLGGAQGHQAGVAWEGVPWGSLPPAGTPASSGGITVAGGGVAGGRRDGIVKVTGNGLHCPLVKVGSIALEAQ